MTLPSWSIQETQNVSGNLLTRWVTSTSAMRCVEASGHSFYKVSEVFLWSQGLVIYNAVVATCESNGPSVRGQLWMRVRWIASIWVGLELEATAVCSNPRDKVILLRERQPSLVLWFEVTGEPIPSKIVMYAAQSWMKRAINRFQMKPLQSMGWGHCWYFLPLLILAYWRITSWKYVYATRQFFFFF